MPTIVHCILLWVTSHYSARSRGARSLYFLWDNAAHSKLRFSVESTLCFPSILSPGNVLK